MIRHIVALRLIPGADERELASVMAGLDGLRDELEGFMDFRHGPNRDYESKSPEYPYGFVADFADAPALERYAVHPAHRALGARLTALCAGGGAGILVIDLEVPS